MLNETWTTDSLKWSLKRFMIYFDSTTEKNKLYLSFWTVSPSRTLLLKRSCGYIDSLAAPQRKGNGNDISFFHSPFISEFKTVLLLVNLTLCLLHNKFTIRHLFLSAVSPPQRTNPQGQRKRQRNAGGGERCVFDTTWATQWFVNKCVFAWFNQSVSLLQQNKVAPSPEEEECSKEEKRREGPEDQKAKMMGAKSVSTRQTHRYQCRGWVPQHTHTFAHTRNKAVETESIKAK